ncbi:MAG: hypothetical protein HC874_14270 [Richelia sp. SL_2_1]|nr:hypothetical protein [Richelia sp. SL_2_1]
MEEYINLFVDGQEAELDLKQELPLALVYSVETLEDLTKISGNYTSRSFTLPATKTNLRLSGRLPEISADNFTSTTRKPARIEVAGIPILSGNAQFTGSNSLSGGINRNPQDIQLDLFGNNADWFSSIRNRPISDFLTTSAELFTEENIENGTNANPLSDLHCYTLIKWKNWINSSYVTWREHTPGLFIYQYLRQLFGILGYNLQSYFFQTEFFNRLILPIPLRDYSQSWKDENVSCIALKTTVQGPIGTYQKLTFDSELLDNAGNYDLPNSRYIAPYFGKYTIVATLEARIAGSSGSFTSFGAIYKNGVLVSPSINIAFVGLLEADDVIEVYYQTELGFTPSDVVSCRFEVRFEVDYTGEAPIQLKWLVPDSWKAASLLTDLTKIFGLVWNTDADSGIVNVEPRDPYRITGMGGLPLIKMGFSLTNTRRI